MSASGTGAALRSAAAAGDAAACQRLLGAAKCVRFSRDEAGRSALHLAASGGHAAVVRVLLNVAAHKEVDSPDGAGCTALQRGAADGHEEVLKLLLARGADVDKQDSVHGNSAIHEAAWKGYSRSVRLLASAGATLAKINAGGFTALHLCCQNGHNQSCRELLLANAHPDQQNNYGDTALHTAARYGHAGVTRILISAQCKVSEQNKNGDTALHIASAMGRRKLTRILLEAGCDRAVRNKQGETARDIAVRKELSEIVSILDVEYTMMKKDKKFKSASKKRSKSKVRFERGKGSKDMEDSLEKPRHWSPYGCHYYPDPEAFPAPRLDSLPQEPLKRGEQYYLDLAGNICKGPVGVGYTCYCAPLFRHLEARLEKDKRELQRAQVRLGQRVAGLEQKLSRTGHGRRSERVITMSTKEPESTLPRSRSLEMLDTMEKSPLQTTRSMDELDPQDGSPDQSRPSVKELVARIQQQAILTAQNAANHDSESSDDDDGPMRMTQHKGPMGDSNMVSVPLSLPNYENVPTEQPRSRSGMYSPTVSGSLIDSNTRYVEPIVKIQESNIRYNDTFAKYNQPSTSKFSDSMMFHRPDIRCEPEMRYFTTAPMPMDPNYRMQYYPGEDIASSGKYFEHPGINARLAKLRVLDSNSKSFESKNPIEGSSRMLDASNYEAAHQKNYEAQRQFEAHQRTLEAQRMLENPQDTVDRDTNNDSGYSTKVYGSSKGNSPSLSGQIESTECLGASSLV